MFLKLPFFYKLHKASQRLTSLSHHHYYTLLFHEFSKFFKLFLSLSQLQIKPKTSFPSSSISLQWINKKQALFSSFANTLRKNAGHGVKMLKLQRFRLLE